MPAAAIDMQIQQTGRQYAAAELDDLARTLCIRDTSGHHPKLRASLQPCAVEHCRARENLRRHTVSVTLRKCGGTSGS